jgi:deoxyadenosine/deoxycytidine kinase
MMVAIEGLIGAGKTTLARWMADKAGWKFLAEPVEENPLLAAFYDDPARYAFPMQMHMLHVRYQQQQYAAFSSTPCVLDRSLPGDRVFATMHNEMGNIGDLEFNTYKEAYRSMTLQQSPSLLIYLEVDPEVAYERMQRRGRTVEAGLELSYMRKLGSHYEDLVNSIEKRHYSWSHGITVHRVPWNADYRDLNASPAEDILYAARRYLAW